MLDQDFDGRFATAILVHLRFTGGKVAVTLASAGHPAALLTRADGATTQLGEPGALLGVFADAEVVEASAVLEPGDSLALYTDGLLEAHAPERTVTPEQMIERLGASAPEAAREAIEALLGLVELDEHVRDDIAILSARVTPAASGVGVLDERPSADVGAEALELGVGASAEGGRRAG
jgi:sigma-B regulation protein RsbU (phosphoserine phosphatase)